MKKNILILIVTIIFSSCKNKKDSFIIKGSIGELAKTEQIDTIFLYTPEGDIMKKSIVNEDGTFTITGKTDRPKMVVIGNYPKKLKEKLVLENTEISCNFIDELFTEIDGGELHEVVFGYTKDPKHLSLYKEYYKISKEQFTDIDVNDEDALDKANEIVSEVELKILEIESRYTQKIIEGEYPTIAKVFSIPLNQDWASYSADKRKELMNEYKKELGNISEIAEYLNYLNNQDDAMAMQETVSNGNTAKPVEGKDIEGKKIDLTSVVLQNEYTMLEFWASWCNPCRGEIPNIKKAYEKYKDKGFNVFSVSIDTNIEDWKVALDQEKMPWLNILVENGFNNEAVKSYGLEGVPASFLIRKDGVIVANNEELRLFNLDRTLDSIFKKKK